MALQQNHNDPDKKRHSFYHSLYDYTMGVLWLAVGLLFLLNRRLDIGWLKSDPLIDTLFGCVGIAYGLFRLYRGYQKKYFRK
ncbi:MAG: hypothetical protein KF746_08955 [Chitinophagaceae bacterium]|nr:hypothetical protein [Chitinophagaceae bacterium]